MLEPCFVSGLLLLTAFLTFLISQQLLKEYAHHPRSSCVFGICRCQADDVFHDDFVHDDTAHPEEARARALRGAARLALPEEGGGGAEETLPNLARYTAGCAGREDKHPGEQQQVCAAWLQKLSLHRVCMPPPARQQIYEVTS